MEIRRRLHYPGTPVAFLVIVAYDCEQLEELKAITHRADPCDTVMGHLSFVGSYLLTSTRRNDGAQWSAQRHHHLARQ